ncbi:hypothetical protein [Persephonella sp.]
MDWPSLENVLGIKPITDEKAQRRLWHKYRKKKKKEKKREEETGSGEGKKVDIYV